MRDVTCAMVTYRSPLEAVGEAVASFASAAGDNALVVVDNASGEEYLSALKTLIGSRGTVIAAPQNKGFGAGNNLAVQHLPESRYLLLMNPDIVIHPGTLEALMAYLEAHPEVGVVSPRVVYPDGTLQPLDKRAPTLLDLFLRRFMPEIWARIPLVKRRLEYYAMLDVGYDAPCDVPFLTGCFMLFRREIFARVGGFNERFFLYLEDADITQRVRAISRAHYAPVGNVTHHWQRGSHKNVRLFAVMLHSMWVYFSTWGWRWW